jgi:phosphonoacetaldehyde hydrolase
MAPPRIKLVVFDWAGTTVDHGSFAPVASFIEAFRRFGVDLTVAEARGPMGLDKRDHIRALLVLRDVAARWRDAHGAPPADRDVDAVFDAFVPLQLETVGPSSTLVPSLLECVATLRSHDIKVGATTGYFREAAQRCYDAAAKQGYTPDAAFCISDVPQGRPAPWMMHRVTEALDVYPPSCVLKVGDTVPDIEEGLNAGAWSAGVVATGSEVGLTADDLAALDPDDRERRLDAARRTLLDAGAHYVIDSVRDVPALVEEIDARLAAGDLPSRRPQLAR